MDFNKIIATILFYILPVFLIGSLMIAIISLFRKNILTRSVVLFSRFFSMIIISTYLYFLVLGIMNISKRSEFDINNWGAYLIEITKGYYYSAYFPSLYFMLFGVIFILLYRTSNTPQRI